MGRTDPVSQLPLPNVFTAALDSGCPGNRPDKRVSVQKTPGSERARARIEHRLAGDVGWPVTVRVTDNVHTMLSIHRRDGVPCVRLHGMFLDAPGEVLEAVSRYVTHGDRRSGDLIDGYIRANRGRIRPSAIRNDAWEHALGAAHDLRAYRDALVERYFDLPMDLAITWGRSAGGAHGQHRQRIIRLGSYIANQRLIRIHPALDRAWIPSYFVASVIYHEMLHHVVPMPVVNGRRCIHTHEFHRREQLFADAARARAWERANLHKLIASRDG